MIVLLFTSIGEISARNFHFGVQAGFDVTNPQLITKPSAISGTRIFYPLIGFNANAYIGFQNSDRWGFSIEPGFIRKGGVEHDVNTDRHIEFQHIFNFIQLPALAEYNITKRFSVSAGPEFAFMLNARLKYDDITSDITSDYERIQISGLVGVNYGITNNLVTGVRYNHDILYSSRITYTNAEGNILGEGREYNQYFQFYLRYVL